MSLNWTQVSTSGLEPVPLPEENFIYTVESADLTVIVPPTLHGPKNALRAGGKVWVSNIRVVFVSPTSTLPPPPPSFDPSASAPSPPSTSSTIFQSSYSYISSLLPAPSSSSTSTPLHSLSIPLSSLHSLKFNQPIFSPPSVSFVFSPVPEGGFPEGANKVEVDVGVREGKAFEFWERLEKARVKSRSRRVEEGEGLPAYPGQH